MRPFNNAGRFALLVATMTAAGVGATGCGSDALRGYPGDASSDSSGDSSSASGDSSSGGDGGGCVFEKLVTGLITNSPSTPVTCGAPLCGCTDNGMLITSVPGSF
jgi:hypothetical protein